MNRKPPLVLILLVLCLAPAVLQSQTAFVYRGHLVESGQPANGSYDLQFGLTDAAVKGNYVADL